MTYTFRTFNGERYHGYQVFGQKSQAEKCAKDYRKKGHKARILHTTRGHEVWWK
jgi:hypothetical protein